jgi:chromosome segregation protein
MEARAEIEQELKIYQRELFGKTFWALRTELDKIEATLQTHETHKQKLEQEGAKLSEEAVKVESFHGQSFSKFRQIQEDLASLQGQKNQMLESLSLVRGKMQSQKSFGGQDAKTLQLNLHELVGKEEELTKQIAASEKAQKEQSAKMADAKAKLVELESKLQKLYAFLQNPNTIDWTGFDHHLKLVENAVSDFYSKIQTAKPWPEVRSSIDSFHSLFGKFKDFVGKAFRDPSVSANLQVELKNLLDAKEQLNQQVQSVELEESKSKITLDFLRKEAHRLGQEKLQAELELKKASGLSADDFLKELISEEDKIKAEVEQFSKKISHLETLFGQERQSQEHEQKHLREVEGHLRGKQEELSKIKDLLSLVQIEKAKLDTQMQVLKEEVFRILGEAEWQTLGQKQEKAETEDLENKIIHLKNQLDTIGGMDELTLKEYQETEARYSTLGNQVNDLKQGMTDLRKIMDELDEHIKLRFNESFHKINEKFEYYFRILFNGGRAYLSVVKAEEEKEAKEDNQDNEESQTQDTLRPEEKVVQKYEKGSNNITGIDIKATPPGKKLATIQALSGGERALTSIALLCSLLSCFPSPFVMLDEVDAALDDANTIRFGQILGTLSHQTQFITITHNRETMAQASMLYGVTMGDDGVSKLLSVKLEQAKAYAK